MISHIEVHAVRWDGETLRWPWASDMCNWHPVVRTTRLYDPRVETRHPHMPPNALWRVEGGFLTEQLNLLTMIDDYAVFFHRHPLLGRHALRTQCDIMHRGRFYRTSQQNFGFADGYPQRYVYTLDRIISIAEYECTNLRWILQDPAIKWVEQLAAEYMTSTVRPLLDVVAKDGYVGPILADALQDAGFGDEDALKSLRANNPIWAVFQMDWLTRKPIFSSTNPCGEIAL